MMRLQYLALLLWGRWSSRTISTAGCCASIIALTKSSTVTTPYKQNFAKIHNGLYVLSTPYVRHMLFTSLSRSSSSFWALAQSSMTTQERKSIPIDVAPLLANPKIAQNRKVKMTWSTRSFVLSMVEFAGQDPVARWIFSV
jgi:hypothetical protein